MKPLAGRVALVTLASRGVGKGIALGLRAEKYLNQHDGPEYSEYCRRVSSHL